MNMQSEIFLTWDITLYIIDLERAWQIIAPPTIHYSDHFFLYASIILRASSRVCYPEFRGCPLFGCCNYIILYGDDVSWYIEQRLLFGRRPLLGVSVNRELIVYNMKQVLQGSQWYLQSLHSYVHRLSTHTELNADPHMYCRWTLEAWHIRQEPNPMNRDRGLLPPVYDSLIRTHPPSDTHYCR